MGTQIFLFLSAGVVIYILLLFLSGKKIRPSLLNFKTQPKSPALPNREQNQNIEGRSRVLNVFFNYNGETFDAYEILGLPGGTDLKTARAKYNENYARRPKEDRRLYDEALSALEHTLK